MNNNYQEILYRLSKSKFRSKFHLKEKEKAYITEKGIDIIEKHAKDFIEKRLSNDIILNDGKQTPMKGHPVFIAQHATATCCRGCLYKWHHIAKNKVISSAEKQYIIEIIMAWIEKEMENNQ